MAPNSPRETANAKPAAAAIARDTTGRSISRHTFRGDAPSTPAASRSSGSIERSAGTSRRTTNGMATTAWASGMSQTDERRSTGARSKATKNPKPMVTAEVPSGTMRAVSVQFAHRGEVPRPEPAIAHDAHAPSTRAITVAPAANSSELPMASSGGTNEVEPRRAESRAW